MLGDERGETLVELLISIAILGISFVALMGGLLVNASSSSRNRHLTDAATVLASAGEALQTATYTPCWSSPNYLSAVQAVTLPSGWTTSTIGISSYQWWNGSGFGTTCYGQTTILGSAGQTLPQSSLGVASTAGFLTPNTLDVTTSAGTQTVTCTSVDTTTTVTFTGCSGGTGTMTSGGSVTVDASQGLNAFATELVTITVTSPDGNSSQSRSFVKGPQ